MKTLCINLNIKLERGREAKIYALICSRTTRPLCLYLHTIADIAFVTKGCIGIQDLKRLFIYYSATECILDTFLCLQTRVLIQLTLFRSENYQPPEIKNCLVCTLKLNRKLEVSMGICIKQAQKVQSRGVTFYIISTTPVYVKFIWTRNN